MVQSLLFSSHQDIPDLHSLSKTIEMGLTMALASFLNNLRQRLTQVENS